jgi:hypothetical protein
MAGLRLGDVHRSRDNTMGNWRMCLVTGRVDNCVLAAFDQGRDGNRGSGSGTSSGCSLRRHHLQEVGLWEPGSLGRTLSGSGS